jgi:sugar phosphate permease
MTTESGSAPRRAVNPLSAIAIAVVATLGILYIVSQFLRNSVGVIAPDLADEIGLTPIELGFLSSIYFFVFAATQLPLGVALDRFGPKLCMLASIGFTVLAVCSRWRTGPAVSLPPARCWVSVPLRS